MAFGLGRHGTQIHFFSTLKGVVGMLRNPEHTESVFDIEDGLRDIAATEQMLEFVRRDPEVAGIIDERWLAERPDLDALLELPEGTLGSTFAHHIRDNGFDPDYFRRIEIRDDVDYVMMRIRQTHDLWHCVTGFGVDRIGEIALKSFELAQLRRPMAAVICAGGVLRFLIKQPEQLADTLRMISLGYRLGLAAGPFLAQKWEENWEVPLDELRASLHVDASAADPNRLDATRPHPAQDAPRDVAGEADDGGGQ